MPIILAMSSATPTDSAQIEIPHIPGPPYIPHKYSIILRSRENLETHLVLLKEHVETYPADSFEGVDFEIGSVVERISCYFATLPPVILQWVQSRPETPGENNPDLTWVNSDYFCPVEWSFSPIYHPIK
ncbi:hypothetical protein DFH07DRAFT_782192 [Mycena maculata]|uniref:Uncharacterized protein n=1 Tax=Mycena maculata TaxID=230809 RepID=A0AAD7MQL0_9AGAR|nr:hypothetical protein DFH07DRAFT_782192 [Mycena maculata]